jgi:hypothetical protein
MSHAGLESSLTGIFATFLSAAAKADAHWYSVRSLSEGVPSLAALLGVSSNNLDTILTLSGFGRIQKGGGLVFLQDKFKNFLVTSETEAVCEHSVFKIPGFKKSQHFIRVGAVNVSKMSKPGTNGLLGPRIHNVRTLQTNFINSIASRSTLFDGGAVSPQDQSSNTAAVTTVEDECVADPTAVGLTLMRMKTMLLPLLLKKEILDLDAFWSPVGDPSEIASVILDIAKDLQLQRDDKLSDILSTIQAPVSPQSKQNPNRYPMLKRYGVSLEDRRVHQSLLSELYHLNKKHHKTTTLHCNLGNNKLSSFVFVPFSKDFRRLKVNENLTKWFWNVLTALGGLGSENETLVDLLTHIG